MTRIFAVSLGVLALAVTLVDVCFTSETRGTLSSRSTAYCTQGCAAASSAPDRAARQLPASPNGKVKTDSDVQLLTGYLDRRGAPGISIDPAARAESDVNPRHLLGDSNPLLTHYSAAPTAFAR